MAYSLIRPLGGPAVLLALALQAAPALSQTGFEDGSFEAGSGAAPSPAPGPAEGGASGGFNEGSFDAGGTPAEPQPPAPPKPPQGGDPVIAPPVGGDVVAPPGGDDFDDGSFDDGNTPAPISGGNEAPQPPQPQPPQPQPQPPQPLPQPPLAPIVPAEIGEFESRDFGVPPTDRLRAGQMHSPTPTAIPGAQAVSTEALVQAIQGGMRLVIIDALGGQYSLPGALMAPGLAESGSFQDRVQQQATAWLGQITGGDATIPIVIYCSDPHCWLSYNASLRAVAAGYTNVYWYRGGLQAWQMAGLQLTPSGF